MRRRGDRIRGRRGYGGVLLVPCLLHDAYRYWLLVAYLLAADKYPRLIRPIS